MLKDTNGEMVTDSKKVKHRWNVHWNPVYKDVNIQDTLGNMPYF